MFKNRLRKMRGKLASEMSSSPNTVPGASSPVVSPAPTETRGPPNPAVVAVERNLRAGEMRGAANDLANFDACVEACDALAASDSGRHPSPVAPRRSGGPDQDGGLTDCLVLVSPDGALLFLPQGFDTPRGSEGSGDSTDEDADGFSDPEDAASSPSPSPTKRASPSPSTALEQLFPGEEYESAVVMGSDLNPGGDRLANGFSARGWSPSAATIALRRSEDALRCTESFFDELVTSRMDVAAKTSGSCDTFRNAIMATPDLSKIRPVKSKFHTSSFGWSDRSAKSSKSSLTRNKSNASSKDSMRTVDLDSNHNMESETTEGGQDAGSRGGIGIGIDMLSMSSSFTKEGKLKSGPIFFPGSTLHAAAVSLEQYYAIVAENDACRWSMACAKSGQNNGTDGGLAAIQLAAEKTAQRAARREAAIHEAQQHADEAEAVLTIQRAEAARRWEAVKKAETDVQVLFEEKTRERSRELERRRQLEENERQAKVVLGQLESGVTQAELWELVSQISSEESSFSPIGLPAAPAVPPTDKALAEEKNGEVGDASSGAIGTDSSRSRSPPPPPIELSDIELQLNLPGLRASAMEADDNVEDAAGAFLNVLSALDTTRKSARVAAEAALLSAANSQAKCLRAVLDMERASIEERLRHIEWLDRQIQTIDVRADLDAFIEHDKRERPGGATRLGDDDDGGIASALAVLNSHSEGRVHRSVSTYEGWGGASEGDSVAISREEFEKAVEVLFADKKGGIPEVDSAKLDRTIKFLVDAVGETSVKGRTHRASLCYALNNQRSVKTEVAGKERFDGLCSVFNALLSGCDREDSDVANAKMCMMLSQTFYTIDEEESEEDLNNSSLAEDRKKRVYVKSRLIRHPLFSDEDFWVQALYQCVTESLTGSGVMSNFEKSARGRTSKGKGSQKLKWYELSADECFEAASQVHAVIFAQLGALSHSMIEFGCTPGQACGFVRRLSIQHQLPLSQRTMLLQHLRRETSSDNVKDKERGCDESLISTELETPSVLSSAEEEAIEITAQEDDNTLDSEAEGGSENAQTGDTATEPIEEPIETTTQEVDTTQVAEGRNKQAQTDNTATNLLEKEESSHSVKEESSEPKQTN